MLSYIPQSPVIVSIILLATFIYFIVQFCTILIKLGLPICDLGDEMAGHDCIWTTLFQPFKNQSIIVGLKPLNFFDWGFISSTEPCSFNLIAITWRQGSKIWYTFSNSQYLVSTSIYRFYLNSSSIMLDLNQKTFSVQPKRDRILSIHHFLEFREILLFLRKGHIIPI